MIARKVRSIAQLRAETLHNNGDLVEVERVAETTFGYEYDSAAPDTDDGFNIVKPTDVAGNGRWLRMRTLRMIPGVDPALPFVYPHALKLFGNRPMQRALLSMGHLRRSYARKFIDNNAPYEGALATTLTELGTRAAASETDMSNSIYQSGAVAGNQAGAELTPLLAANTILAQHSPAFCFMGYIPGGQGTSIRFFSGISTLGIATQLGSDTPAGSYMGFRFSTDAGDATLKCVSDNASGVPNVIDTGFAIAGFFVVLETWIEFGSVPRIFFRFGRETLIQTFDTALKVPSGSANLIRVMAGVETRTAASRHVGIGVLHAEV